MGNIKDHPIKKINSKKEVDDDNDLVELKEDYSIVDEDDNYQEPKGPKKEELKNNVFIADDDDDFDDDF